MESFTTFPFLAIIDHIILYYFPQLDFEKWLQLHLRYSNSTWNKETEK